MKKLDLDEDSSLQDFLSIGYIFLLVLGILKDTVYYWFIDVHILAYSSVLDVLLSPIIFLTQSVITVIVTIAMVWGLYWHIKHGASVHEKYRTKWWYRKFTNVEKLDQKYAQPQKINQLIRLTAITFICFYFGAAIGGGAKVSKNLKNGTLESDHELTFQDKRVEKVKLIGQNSQYVFYVLEGSGRVSISPIQGNVTKFEQLEGK